MDVVGKGDQILAETVVVLHRDLGDGIALAAGEVDDIIVDRGLVLVEPADEFTDTALIAHAFPLFLPLAQILQGNLQSAVEEGLLAHAGVQNLIVVYRVVEHLRIRLEANRRSGMVCFANHMDFFDDISPGKTHLVDFSVLMDLNHQPLGKRIDHRSTDTVKTARDLIASSAELAAGVQHRKDDFQRALSGLFLNIYGNAASVVGDADDVPRFDAHFNMGAVSGQRLVDGVVDNLIDQVMQTGG